MRDDFTSGFVSGKNKATHAPVFLLKLEWLARPSVPALVLRIADRALITGSETWQPLVLNWQGNGPETLKGVTLWNGVSNLIPGVSRFTDLFTQYPPERASVILYQWFEGEGLDENDLAPLFAGVIDDLVEYDGVECHLPLTAYSETLGRHVVGTPVTLSDYPNAPEENLGQSRPIVIGEAKGVPGVRVRNVRRTQLTSVVLPGASIINVSTTGDFPDAGVLEVNDDEVIYTGRTSTQFTGCSGIAEFHYADDEVLEKVSDHRFLFNDPAFPIQAINRVCVANQPVDPSDYMVDIPRGEVIFSRQPREVRSIDTKFLQLQFDAVAVGNTALDASHAMQPNPRTRYAKINQANRKLNLSQVDNLTAVGQIGRVLLRVEHFMEERLTTDSISVGVSGVGEVGLLSPPGVDDLAITSGSSDMTHNHLDTFGFPIDIPQPPINPTSNADHVVEQGAISGTGKYQNLVSGGNSISIDFPAAPPGAIRGEYQLNLNVEGGLFGPGEAALYFHGNKVAEWNSSRFNFDYTPSFTFNGSNQPGTMNLTVGVLGGQWTVSFTSVKRLLFYPHNTQATQLAQQTLKTGGTSEASLQPALSAVTEKSTRTVVDFFDVTPEVDGDWSWFTGREVEVEYKGSRDGRTVFVLHTAFEIEYARRRLKATDAVTADVNGVIDDPAGSVSGVANALIERPEHLFMWSLKQVLQLSDSAIDTASFFQAGSDLLTAVPGGYRLTGLIQNRPTLTSLWEEWMVSSRCRLHWNSAGRAQLLFRRLNASSGLEGQEVKSLNESSVLVNPNNGKPRVRLRRGPGKTVSTVLNLPYERDWNVDSGAGQYRKFLRVQDTVQSEVFGVIELPGGKPLDWCVKEEMAEDLAAFYLAEVSRPSILFECDVALEHLDLEWGDIVKLNHPDEGLNGVFAQLTGRTDLVKDDTPDGLQAVRLQFHLFPIEFLKELSQETSVPVESLELLLDWKASESESVPVQEFAGCLDQPGAFVKEVQGVEAALFFQSMYENKAAQSLEALFNDFNLKNSLDAAGAGEAVFTSASGGWGSQAWGFSGWGGREVLV